MPPILGNLSNPKMAIKMSFVFGPVASIVSVLDNAKVSYAIIFPVTVDMINFTLGLGTGVIPTQLSRAISPFLVNI
jgi:hypothetical protein